MNGQASSSGYVVPAASSFQPVSFTRPGQVEPSFDYSRSAKAENEAEDEDEGEDVDADSPQERTVGSSLSIIDDEDEE